KRLPNVSYVADTSPMEEPSAARLLFCHVMPPSVLYFVTRAQVSDMKRLSGLRGLMAMHSSTLLPEALVILMFGPTVSVTAAWAEESEQSSRMQPKTVPPTKKVLITCEG